MAVRQVRRVAAYAVVIRDGQVLLTRISPRISPQEVWTLPGGGLDHGEAPRDAVVREVHEETGLPVRVSETAHVFSLHLPTARREGRVVDTHSLRIVYEGWVPVDAPEPRVVEKDGSTVEVAWQPLSRVLDGSLPVVGLVTEALAAHRPWRAQRVAAYALIRRDDAVLLSRVSPRGYHTGLWSLPGGGVAWGESPVEATRREVREETGLECTVGEVVTVVDERVQGTAPTGRDEDLHSIGIVYAATVTGPADRLVVEQGGTSDDAAWVPLADISSGVVPVVDLVRTALAARR